MHILISIPNYDPDSEELAKLCASIEQSLAGEFHGVEVQPLSQASLRVVAVGDPFDGLTLRGPFENADEATSWGEATKDKDWHVVEIYPVDA